MGSLGQIGGIFVDKDDNVWISQRPRTVNDRDKRAERGDKAICCYTAPSVVEFNQKGDVVKAWGGPKTAQGYDWPQNEHGMLVDYKGNVWIGGNGENDGMLLKFTNDGKFLMAIGKSAAQTNSAAPDLPGCSRSVAPVLEAASPAPAPSLVRKRIDRSSTR